jgi:hypothetical protein
MNRMPLEARWAVAVLLLAGAAVLPFVPGRYDPLAMPLAITAITVARVSLLLVPIAALHLLVRSQAARARLAVSALVAGALVWCAGAVAMSVHSMALGIAWLALGIYTAWRWQPEPKALGASRAFALTLLLVPPAAVVSQVLALEQMVTASRNRAIARSAPMIADIEAYRVTHGAYPDALPSLWGDYRPDVIGIERFHYARSGTSFSLHFEQPTVTFGTREIVMYHPLDDHHFASHDQQLLRFSIRAGGWYAAEATGLPHWKAFRFD